MSKIIVKKAEHFGITRQDSVETCVSKILQDAKTVERCEGLTNRGVRVIKDTFGRMTFVLRFSNPVADMKVLLSRFPEAAFELGFGKSWEAAPKKQEEPVKPLEMEKVEAVDKAEDERENVQLEPENEEL